MVFSLKRSDINSGNPVSLGQVQNLSLPLKESLVSLDIPGTKAEDQQILSFLGVSGEVILSGLFADTLANVRTFIANMRIFLSGNQKQAEFHDDLMDEDVDVLVDNFIPSAILGIDLSDPSTVVYIEYSLLLKLGKSQDTA